MSKKTILITGGAGYIGSHVNKMLIDEGFKTVVLDNLSAGNRQAVIAGDFVDGDVGDPKLLNSLFQEHSIDAVMHLAAFTNVGESVANPLKYYLNNVASTLQLLTAMQKWKIDILIFSSTAAIFGTPQELPISETHPCQPINPYGQSKLAVEQILKDCAHAYGLRSCSLRYFNAAGGDPHGVIKNFKQKETNLIPIILKNIKRGMDSATIFGTDYCTPDGTCIRDYVHIEDIGAAHVLALRQLLNGQASCSYNLGNGNGFSVRQVIAAVEKVTGHNLIISENERRAGDPPMLIASSAKAKRELGWQPRYSSLEEMVAHAWKACL